MEDCVGEPQGSPPLLFQAVGLIPHTSVILYLVLKMTVQNLKKETLAMSSHVKTNDDLSNSKATPPPQTPEQKLFENVARTQLIFKGMSEIHENSSNLISNLRGSCDVLRDSISAINHCCQSGGVVELSAESLIGFYDNQISQLDVIDVQNNAQSLRYYEMKSKIKQLQKRLFSIERELNETLEVNTKYYAYIQELEGELSIDADTERGFGL